MASVTTPVEGFNGKVIGVSFADGKAEVEDEGQLSYFARHGYTIGEAEVVEEAAEKPFSQLNKAELIALAEAEGIDLSEAKTNDEIRATITAARDK